MGEYTSVIDRPTADAAGGGSSAAGWPAGFEPVPYSPFGHPFAGWIALSDYISDSNPELADAMRALATVLQAAIEQMTVERFPEIRSLLAQAGIPQWCVEDAERSLLSGLLPLSVEELAEQASETFAELRETETVEPTEPAGSGFLASIVHYGGHAILGREIEEAETRPPQLPVRYEDLPEGFLDHFLPSTRFRTVASLDLPEVATARGFSIWCRKNFRRRGDCLEATEHTYVDRDVLGLSNTRFRGDSVLEKYRDDIDDWLPEDFSESIDLSHPVDQYYYVYELTEPKRSGAARKLRKTLQTNRMDIQTAFNVAVDTASTLATAAGAPVGVPVPVITTLAKPFGRMAFNSLLTRFERSLADTNMTPWNITHTTVILPQYPVPLSVFILLSPAAPSAKLHRIRRDDINPDVSTMDLGYEEKKRAYQRGRGMVGLSYPPTRTCPADLWTHVARENQPAAWTEPGQDQGGFRILVPHAEASDDASYVSALRADLLAAGDEE